MSKNTFLFLVLAAASADSAWAQAGPDARASDIAVQRTATCDEKCMGKKTGESQAKLHRIGWEAAIRDLSIAGTEKQQILDLATKVEDRMRKAHADLSFTKIAEAKEEGQTGLRYILGSRYNSFIEAEHWGRFEHIRKETGVAPVLSKKKR
jgi:hypothetical protein